MTAATRHPAASGRNHVVDELSEDLDVAIREFLERYPGTSPQRIRTAMRLAERRNDGGRFGRAAPAIALIAVFVVGIALGLMLG